MASLQSSSVHFSSSSCKSSTTINAAISVPKLPRISFSAPKQKAGNLVKELNLKNGLTSTILNEKHVTQIISEDEPVKNSSMSAATAQLYAILEAVSDRIEMHRNIGEQRDNWNKLLLNNINMITLTATTIAGTACSMPGAPILALKLTSGLLFSAAAGMLLIMNKIQPSQLAEEQRNATKLFKQLKTRIQTRLALYDATEIDVKEAMEKVLALDKSYPLPLLGKMIEKFPEKFEPAVWWPKKSPSSSSQESSQRKNNGWNEELEMEMMEIVSVLKEKDSEDYMRLGNIVLRVNKILAISGPLLTGIAAAGSAFLGHGSWAAIVAVTAGALAAAVNTFEHAGQVGMVLEMYRNCAGFFKLLEESIESTVEEEDFMKREDGDMFEMKVALQLGRSLSELRDLARNSHSSHLEATDVEEFASKLF